MFDSAFTGFNSSKNSSTQSSLRDLEIPPEGVTDYQPRVDAKRLPWVPKPAKVTYAEGVPESKYKKLGAKRPQF